MPTPGSVSPNVASFSPRACGHEPALALLLGPPLQERQRVEPDVDALDDTERRVGTLQLLAQDREADVVHPGAAVGLRDRRAEEAQLAHPGEHLAVDLALLVPLADVRQDLRLGEGPDALLDEAVLVGEGEVDHRGIVRAAADMRPRPAARGALAATAIRDAAAGLRR